MALETPTGIWDLDPLNPTSDDDRSEGDDHLRNIKSALQHTFPDITSTVNVSSAEFNLLTGLTYDVNTSLRYLYLVQNTYGDMRLTSSSTEFSASTSLSIFTGFDTVGSYNETGPSTASGAIAVYDDGYYEVAAHMSISASSAANITIAIYNDDTDTGIHASTLVPAQGRSNVSCGGFVSMAAVTEARVRILATTAKLITVKDAHLRVKRVQ